MRRARLLALVFVVAAVAVPASAAAGAATVGRYIGVLNSSVSDP
jgi:hypothetical protein